jgi:hypothetical protein
VPEKVQVSPSTAHWIHEGAAAGAACRSNSHCFTVPTAGSRPKKAFVQGMIPETDFSIHWVPAPKRTRCTPTTVKVAHSLETLTHVEASAVAASLGAAFDSASILVSESVDVLPPPHAVSAMQTETTDRSLNLALITVGIFTFPVNWRCRSAQGTDSLFAMGAMCGSNLNSDAYFGAEPPR